MNGFGYFIAISMTLATVYRTAQYMEGRAYYIQDLNGAYITLMWVLTVIYVALFATVGVQ